jgi:hypothetical protein
MQTVSEKKAAKGMKPYRNRNGSSGAVAAKSFFTTCTINLIAGRQHIYMKRDLSGGSLSFSRTGTELINGCVALHQCIQEENKRDFTAVSVGLQGRSHITNKRRASPQPIYAYSARVLQQARGQKEWKKLA